MIFISHNHKDKPLVDMIARQLEISFGRDNIFYDSWSIQPGDSIIGKMNEGLQQTSIFFYFLSQNSLNSQMVSREWQSALISAINQELKFIPIRLDDCDIPAIMRDLLYIDLYGMGIDEAIVKMKSVISGGNTYTSGENIENLVAYLHKRTDFEIDFEIRATMFSVQDVTFAFVCNNKIGEFEVKSCTETMISTNYGDVFKYINGERISTNLIIGKLHRVLTPNSPFKGKLKSKSSFLNFEGIIQVLSEDNIKELKIVWR
ncbi:toll/interleukin-1 receptor domain-containing protein [Streptococcus salivarius]|jgi:hypothetical protein|uniref:toll/interleukin-1 receptor domain-containing protein n=1 Tax=Streptococcus salivarius TaxID=1304 RepID=UPI001583735F|nr:toll/interleukin-1 receptor domain-containing protein [Streptococcus salivarius]